MKKSERYNEPKYVFIRNNGGWENWNMIMIEEYSCENKRQLEMREEQIRVERNTKLNKNACSIKISKYQRQLELNPNTCKEHYQRTLELNPTYNKNKYQRQLELNPNCNKERYKKYKENLLKKQREKYTCELCGKELSLGSKLMHNKRKHSL